MPVTVTVCGRFQFAGVKVSDEVETVPSVVSLLETGIVTFEVGPAESTTLKLAVPPASVVCTPVVGVTVTPAEEGTSETAPIRHSTDELSAHVMGTEAAPGSALLAPRTRLVPVPVEFVHSTVCPGPTVTVAGLSLA